MTLLIWEEIPERIHFYALETHTPEERSVLETAHCHYINFENSDAVEEALGKINAALSDSYEGYEKGDAAFPWVGRWVERELVAATLPTSGPFHTVYSCGFVL